MRMNAAKIKSRMNALPSLLTFAILHIVNNVVTRKDHP